MTPDSRIHAGLGDAPAEVDLVVAGLGITGAGVALDAASRGLRVLAVDAHDLAFGTSRWSSKLIHGGLRYLAHGQVRVARESAVERGILLTRTAPHLVRAEPMLLPFTSDMPLSERALARLGVQAGDWLRRSARTPAHVLPRPRLVPAAEAAVLAPGLRRNGLRGGLLYWDGQLEDDARLVIAVARTAVQQGASVHTRSRVLAAENLGGTVTVRLRDELRGSEHLVRAKALVNATGVWAGDLAPNVRLRPSRGTHLVLRPATLPGLRSVVTVPIPGAANRFVMVLPQPDGTTYVGLTDVPAELPIPDVPEPTEAEIEMLLEVAGSAFEVGLSRADVAGAFAGLRPLLEGEGTTADLSRDHAVIGGDGIVTVVGGKLTTYRRMAQDAVDAAVAMTGVAAADCWTHRLPLTGARPHASDRTDLPARLVRRYGHDATSVLETARSVTGWSEPDLLAPISAEIPTTMAELVFGVAAEGACDVEDLLERRTRIGLIPHDLAPAIPAAEKALAMCRAFA